MFSTQLYKKVSETKTHVTYVRNTLWNWVYVVMLIGAVGAGLSLNYVFMGLIGVIWGFYVLVIYNPSRSITNAIKEQSKLSQLDMTGSGYSFANPAVYTILKTNENDM